VLHPTIYHRPAGKTVQFMVVGAGPFLRAGRYTRRKNSNRAMLAIILNKI
jgi:hypothetical protein